MKKTILILSILVVASLSYAQHNNPFGNSALTLTELSPDKQDFVNRISLNYNALSTTFITVSDITDLQEESSLNFTLPSGEQLTANGFHLGEEEENTFVWTGKIGNDGNFISLASNEGGTGGMILYQDKFYSIHPIDSDNSLFVESLRSVHEEVVCGMDTIGGTGTIFQQANECLATECESPTIDVLLVWTDEAVTWIGGLGNPFIIAIYGALGMESINIALANSGVTGRVRYHRFQYSEFTYAPAPNINTDISTLVNDPAILAARADFRADLVVLLTNQTYTTIRGQIFGGVNEFGLGVNNAFAITEIPFLISPRWTLAHELGHLFGARHNRFNNGGNDDTNICAHALRFSGNSGVQRTILANLGMTGQRILHYSNPAVFFDGAATGTTDDNNAGRIAHTSCEIGDFYPDPFFGITINAVPTVCSEDGDFSAFAIVRQGSAAYPSPPLPYTFSWSSSSGITGNGTSLYVPFSCPAGCNITVHVILTAADGTTVSASRTVQVLAEPCFAGGGNTADRGQDPDKTLSSQADNHQSFTLFPNPATEQVSVSFAVLSQMKAGIQLVDLSGKVVYELPSAIYPKGMHKRQIPTASIPKGLYFCILKYENAIETQKIIIQ